MPTPLLHFKILDLTRILAGPFATQLLADLGADVLKIEPPEGDFSRHWGPPFLEDDRGGSLHFQCANRGKRSLVLDFSQERDRVRLEELIREADVLAESFLPDTSEHLGLDWEHLQALNPKLILASLRGFASDVPSHRRACTDFIAQAEGGWMALTGAPQGQPMKAGPALADVTAALYFANGIQAALLHRERTGEALHVEVPILEAALAALGNAGATTLMTGKAPQRCGNAHANLVPCQTFRCADATLALGVTHDPQFEVLALWLGLDLDAEPGWRSNAGRVQDRERLVPALEARFAALPSDAVLAFCATHAIPAGRVRSVEDALFRQAGLQHHLIQPLCDPATGSMVPLLASPVMLNGQRACNPLPPPSLAP